VKARYFEDKKMTCNCEIEVCEKLKEVNEFYSVELELNSIKKRPFTNFLVVERKGNKKEPIPMPCKFCPFCGVKYDA